MHHYGFSKNFKTLKFSLSLKQKQCSKFQYFGFSEKKVIETQKCTQAAVPPFLPCILCILWGVITFEWVMSLCWNFQDNLILYIPFIWKIFTNEWLDNWCTRTRILSLCLLDLGLVISCSSGYKTRLEKSLY